MFGLGRKDKDGKQVRIEHRGKYTRASRTGGVALRTEKNCAPLTQQPTLLMAFVCLLVFCLRAG